MRQLIVEEKPDSSKDLIESKKAEYAALFLREEKTVENETKLRFVEHTPGSLLDWLKTHESYEFLPTLWGHPSKEANRPLGEAVAELLKNEAKRNAILPYLTNARLLNLDLASIRLLGANLENASFLRSNLCDANLSNANLRQVSFYKANLSHAVLLDADLKRASFFEVNLSHAHLSGADLSGTNFSGANLSHAHLFAADLNGTDFSGANLTAADLTKQIISPNVALDNANLTDAIFTGATLINVNFSSAMTLEGAGFNRATLNFANLSGANLSGASFEDAWLVDTNLDKANLTGSTLKNAYLKGASLRRANLTRTEVTISQLLETKSLYQTLLPYDFAKSEIATDEPIQIKALENKIITDYANELVNGEKPLPHARAILDLFYENKKQSVPPLKWGSYGLVTQLNSTLNYIEENSPHVITFIKNELKIITGKNEGSYAYDRVSGPHGSFFKRISPDPDRTDQIASLTDIANSANREDSTTELNEIMNQLFSIRAQIVAKSSSYRYPSELLRKIDGILTTCYVDQDNLKKYVEPDAAPDKEQITL